MKITKEQREIQNSDLNKKFIITFGIIAFCILAYLLVIGPYLNRGEGDPFFVFFEVPINDTINSSVIHLEDKEIINVNGLDLRQENGKITRIYFRNSDTTPDIDLLELKQKIESHPYNQTLRKYVEYKGIYYYAVWYTP